MAISTHPQQKDKRVTLRISPKKFQYHLQKQSLLEAQRLRQGRHDALHPSTHQAQRQQHRRQYPLYNPENIPTDHDNVYLIRAHSPSAMRSQFSYDQLKPDFNQVSHHLLDTTAFTSKVSMSRPDVMRAYSSDVLECYTKISNHEYSQPSPLACEVVKIDDRTLDYDRFGILYEYNGKCYVMCPPPEQPRRVQGHFLPKECVGGALRYEWESVPKRRIGAHGICATEGHEGWWNVHSRNVKALRVWCAHKAGELVKLVKVKAPSMSAERFERELEKALNGGLVAYWEVMEEVERQKEDEAKSVWEEFMVGEEEDGGVRLTKRED